MTTVIGNREHAQKILAARTGILGGREHVGEIIGRVAHLPDSEVVVHEVEVA